MSSIAYVSASLAPLAERVKNQGAKKPDSGVQAEIGLFASDKLDRSSCTRSRLFQAV